MDGDKPAPRRCHVYAWVTVEEHAAVRALAARDGMSMADYVRRAINAMLLEQGDEHAFLRESGTLRGRPKTRPGRGR
jgi:hypothetical protein